MARPVTRPLWEAGGSDTVVIWDRGLLSPALVSTRNVRRRLGCPCGQGGGRDATQRPGRDGAQTQVLSRARSRHPRAELCGVAGAAALPCARHSAIRPLQHVPAAHPAPFRWAL